MIQEIQLLRKDFIEAVLLGGNNLSVDIYLSTENNNSNWYVRCDHQMG